MADQIEGEQPADADLPNETALEYLQDALKEAANLIDRPFPHEWRARRGFYHSDGTYERDRFGSAHGETTRARLDESDWEYDRTYHQFNKLDELSTLGGLHQEATEALEAGEYDRFADAFEAQIDSIPVGEPVRFDDVETWLGVLERSHVASATDRNEQSEIANAVRAAVKSLSIELVKLIAQARETLHEVEWRQLEHVIATALEGIGFEVELTPPAKDGG